MENKYLSIAGTAALIFLCLFLVVNIDAKLNEVSTNNTVTFSGEGRVPAIPDIAIVNFSIVTESTSSKTAQDRNSAKSNTIVEFLKNSGLAETDIKTTSYNIYPQYQYREFEQPRISGYQVNQTIEIKIRKLDGVSNIIDGIVTSGANQVNNLSYTIEDPEALRTLARAEAIENAKQKARTLKKQVGISLGKIVNFSENTGGYPIPYPVFERADIGIGGGGGPSLPVGENEIVVNITLTYQIR